MYRGDACIVGIGTSEKFGFDLGKSPLHLETEAFVAALADAGLTRNQIDGFLTAHGSPYGLDYEQFVVTNGLECRWVSQMWSHGRWATNLIAEAALVVAAGVADYVAIANASITSRGYGRYLRRLGGASREGMRDEGGSHGEWDIHGLDTPGSATSLVAQRYMEKYGATTDDLAGICIAFRAAAQQNPMAIMRSKALSLSSYYSEPEMAGPFRRPDYCLSSEGATCLIVTTQERARDLQRPPVSIAGFQGIHASRNDHILFARPGLGVGFTADVDWHRPAASSVYEMAAVDRDAIDGLYVYDSFSSNVWMTLERFGFCELGEAPDYIRDVGIDLNSPMPVNSNGGLLSEAHLIGMGHIIEMVRQLRGAAGHRQLSEPAALQWGTPIGDSIILVGGQS